MLSRSKYPVATLTLFASLAFSANSRTFSSDTEFTPDASKFMGAKNSEKGSNGKFTILTQKNVSRFSSSIGEIIKRSQNDTVIIYASGDLCPHSTKFQEFINKFAAANNDFDFIELRSCKSPQQTSSEIGRAKWPTNVTTIMDGYLDAYRHTPHMRVSTFSVIKKNSDGTFDFINLKELTGRATEYSPFALPSTKNSLIDLTNKVIIPSLLRSGKVNIDDASSQAGLRGIWITSNSDKILEATGETGEGCEATECDHK